MQPYYNGVADCVSHIEAYVLMLNDDYKRKLHGGSSDCPAPTAFDPSNFFMCEDRPYETEVLATSNGETGGIMMDCIFPMIGPSRIRSYSMFIEPLVQLRTSLKTDQLLELAFAAALLTNPLQYHWSLMNLACRHSNGGDPFHFGEHPFYDLMDALGSTFANWQSAKRRRFSPTGGGQGMSIPEIFGLGAHADGRIEGKITLTRIVQKLFKYVEWIDTLAGRGRDPVIDLPLELVQEWQCLVVNDIRAIQPCQFGLFRLGVFTTIVTGCGILIPGPHLRQLAIPAPNCASQEHLKRANIKPEHVDKAMRMIADSLGIPYHRDVIETLLVSCDQIFHFAH